jgi:hypothetical protein
MDIFLESCLQAVARKKMSAYEAAPAVECDVTTVQTVVPQYTQALRFEAEIQFDRGRSLVNARLRSAISQKCFDPCICESFSCVIP